MDERTTKALASRIDARYARTPPRMRRLWRVAAIALPLCGLAWVALHREPIYQPGPLSPAHVLAAARCADCHTDFSRVDDAKCAKCHQPGVHQTNSVLNGQPGAPRCASCHSEHRQAPRLSQVSDRVCVQCHADLRTTDGSKDVVPHLTGFADGQPHPEFSALREGSKDPTRLKFGHAKHLAVNLDDTGFFDNAPERKDPGRPRDRLECTDCHLPDATGALMAPITYTRACSPCHTLDYDDRFTRPSRPELPDVVPHDDPLYIHGYLLARFTSYAQQHPEALVKDPPTLTRMMNMEDPQSCGAVRCTAEEWVKEQVDMVERGFLLSKRCVYCHEVTLASADACPPPAYAQRLQVRSTQMPGRWLTGARFSHISHRALSCVSCHSRVAQSTRTEDVNLPSIKKCQECHSEQSGAGSHCVECHVYHDKTGVETYQGSLATIPAAKDRPTR